VEFPNQNLDEIEKILPQFQSWSKDVKIYGSNCGNRLVFDYEDGVLQSIEFRIDLRREYPEVREFVQSMISLAEKNAWCFCNEEGVILMPDYACLAEDLSLSDAQHFMNTSPAAFCVDGF